MINTNQLTARVLWVLAILGVCFLLLAEARAQDWHVTDQVTVAWDAVTTDGQGNTLPEPVSYRVYLKDAVSGASEVAVQETVDTSSVLTFDVEGSYIVGVSAYRVINDTELESDITWSDGSLASPGPWGIKHFFIPASPGGLRKQ